MLAWIGGPSIKWIIAIHAAFISYSHLSHTCPSRAYAIGLSNMPGRAEAESSACGKWRTAGEITGELR